MRSEAIPTATLTVAHPHRTGYGFLADVAVAPPHVFASGGTHHRATFLRSTEGTSFSRATTGLDSPGFRGMCVLSETRLILVGEYSLIAISEDQGGHWRRIPIAQKMGCLYSITANQEGELFVGGDDGLLHSVDQGESWQVLRRATGRIFSLHAGQERLYALGDKSAVLHKGQWQPLDLPNKAPLTTLLELPGGSAVAVGDRGQIFRSSAPEAPWEAVPCPVDADLEDMTLWHEHILVVGSQGTLLISTDEGRSFRQIPVDARSHFWSIDWAPGAYEESVYIGGVSGQVHILSMTLPVSKADPKDPKKVLPRKEALEDRERRQPSSEAPSPPIFLGKKSEAKPKDS